MLQTRQIGQVLIIAVVATLALWILSTVAVFVLDHSLAVLAIGAMIVAIIVAFFLKTQTVAGSVNRR